MLHICTMTFLFITIFLLVSYSILILYYRTSWLGINNFVPKKEWIKNDLPFVSVIIAARNEEDNIGACIESVMLQTYPSLKFELIIINDHSTDNTVSVIRSFKQENIRLLHLEDYTGDKLLNSYKKKSIEMALQYAKGELIITTDADCVVPVKWLETMAAFYIEKDPVFIAAPVTFLAPSKNDSLSLKALKIFQSLDFMTLQGITGASVSKGFHNMCNGANLAYPKEIFYRVNGFEGIDEIASGDDMLLMHKIQKAFPEKIGFLKSPDCVVQTQAASSVSSFLNQRIRWASKAGHYTDKKITGVLVLVYAFNVWMLILGIASFFSLQAFYIFLVALFIKVVAELSFLFPVARFFGQRNLLWYFIPSQPFHILYTVMAGWLGIFGSYRWKGRKVK